MNGVPTAIGVNFTEQLDFNTETNSFDTTFIVQGNVALTPFDPSTPVTAELQTVLVDSADDVDGVNDVVAIDMAYSIAELSIDLVLKTTLSDLRLKLLATMMPSSTSNCSTVSLALVVDSAYLSKATKITVSMKYTTSLIGIVGVATFLL